MSGRFRCDYLLLRWNRISYFTGNDISNFKISWPCPDFTFKHGSLILPYSPPHAPHAFQLNLDNFRYDTDVTQILNPHLCLQNHKTNLFFTTSNLLVKYSWFFWKFTRSLGGSIISRSKSQPNQVHHWILHEQISQWMHWLGQCLICLIMDPPNT